MTTLYIYRKLESYICSRNFTIVIHNLRATFGNIMTNFDIKYFRSHIQPKCLIFRSVSESAKRDYYICQICLSLPLSFNMEQLGHHWMDFHEI